MSILSGYVSGKQTRMYKIWANIKQRCYNEGNPRYKDYGGRGIYMEPLWRGSFQNFYIDVGAPPTELHTIDRIDNDQGYFAHNIRWATRAEQNRNSRRCVMITIGSVSKPINVWCRENGIPYVTFKQRRRNGWGLVKAVTQTPNDAHRTKRITANVGVSVYVGD